MHERHGTDFGAEKIPRLVRKYLNGAPLAEFLTKDTRGTKFPHNLYNPTGYYIDWRRRSTESTRRSFHLAVNRPSKP
jgi:hypothetical protein